MLWVHQPGQRDGKAAALGVSFTETGHASTVEFNEVFYQRQAKPQAALRSVWCSFCLGKKIECSQL